MSGSVYWLPDLLPKANAALAAVANHCPPGALITANDFADASGNYTFADNCCAAMYGNNWGLMVFRSGDSGPGEASFVVHGGTCADGTGPVTIMSNEMGHADVFVPRPNMERPDMQPPPPPHPPAPDPPCPKVGEPISLVTGNMYLAHTDADIPGRGDGLHFVRTYNSMTRSTGQYGAFGSGWNHSYERRITFPYTDVVMLRGPNGVALYFQDTDHDLRYQPSVPITEQSSVVKVGSNYFREFRRGGSETYNAAGKLTSIVDPYGNTVTLAYNGSNQLTTITEASGRALTLTYSSGLIQTLSGPAGLIATYGYTTARLTSITYPASSGGYTIAYDTSGRLATVTDLSGRVLETHAYQTDGKAITSSLAGGVEGYTVSYNALNTVVTDALGSVTTYDWTNIHGMRYVTKITGPCASCGGGDQTQSWTYDDKGHVTSYTDGDGNTTTYTYDATTGDLLTEAKPLGHTTTYTYYADGRVQTKATPNSGLTTYVYGPAGPTSITEKVTATQDRTTAIHYTTQGRPDSITDPRNKVTTMTYDALGDLRTVTEPLGQGQPGHYATAFDYDSMARRIRVTDAVGNKTETDYDARGRVTKIRTFNGTQPLETGFTYDLGGRRLSATDPLSRTTDYAYDTYGRLLTVTEPLVDGVRPVTAYGYDLMSNLTSLEDANEHETVFRYDGYNRVDQVTYPGNRIEAFTYDTAGHLATKTDRKNVTTTHAYDDLGRLTGKTYSDGSPSVTYTYDAAAQLGFMTSAANGTDTLSWTYDFAGQLRTESSTLNASTVAYGYDLAGNRSTLSLDGGLFLSYAYDDNSRLQSLTRSASVFGLAYDEANRRTSLTHPNGIVTSYGYDTMSRLTSLAAQLSATPITSFAYTYDDASNRTARNGLDFVESYSYDPLNRLTQAVRDSLTSEQYDYDKVGNRLLNLTHSDWTYNERNELQSYDGVAFTYDLNGNTLTKAEVGANWTYEWTVENQLKRVLLDGAEVARFSYDPIGRRAQKVAGAMTTSFTYDGEDILRTIAGGVTLKYIHGPGIDEPLAREASSGSLTSYHADALGSIQKETNPLGAVTLTRRYDAFGNLQAPGSTAAGYAYTGREWDAETGLYYYRARSYDPSTARFASEDPVGFEGGVNFYSYVTNNPVTETDPFGLWGCDYSISAGTLTCYPHDPIHHTQFTIPVASGNNGGGTHCKNNPKCTSIPNRGPTPQGWWRWTNGWTSTPNGRVLMPLPGNSTTRTQFRTHSCMNPFGPSTTPPFCSEGCITGTVEDIRRLNGLLDQERPRWLRVRD